MAETHTMVKSNSKRSEEYVKFLESEKLAIDEIMKATRRPGDMSLRNKVGRVLFQSMKALAMYHEEARVTESSLYKMAYVVEIANNFGEFVSLLASDLPEFTPSRALRNFERFDFWYKFDIPEGATAKYLRGKPKPPKIKEGRAETGSYSKPNIEAALVNHRAKTTKKEELAARIEKKITEAFVTLYKLLDKMEERLNVLEQSNTNAGEAKRSQMHRAIATTKDGEEVEIVSFRFMPGGRLC